MRPLFCLLIACFATGILFAQNSVERFIAQYSEVEHVNNLSLQGSLLHFAANYNDDKRAGKAMAKLNKLSALWIDEYNPIAHQDVKRLMKNLRKDHFEPLVMVKNGTANVNFWIQENGNRITSVVLLVDDEDNFLLVNLTGNLRFEDLGEIDLDIEGMEHFKKLPKKRSELKRA